MKTKIRFVAKYKVEGVENYCSVQDCVDYLQDKPIVGIDLETSKNLEVIGDYNESVYRGGLDPYLSNIVMLQLGTVDEVFVIDVRDFTKEELSPVLDFIHWNSDVTFVGVNLKFEQKHLNHKYGTELKEVFDCMVAELALYNGINTRVSLLELSIKYLNASKKENLKLFEDKIDYSKVTLDSALIEANENLLTPFELANDIQIDKSTRMEFVKIGSKPFTEKQINYGADDIIFPILIREKQLLGHTLYTSKPYRPLSNLKLESKFVLVAAEMELAGMPFYTQEWTDLHTKNSAIYYERKAKLDAWMIENMPEYTQMGLFSGGGGCIIEWSSPAQVVGVFRKLDICPKEKSKSTRKLEWTVGADAVLTTLPNHLKDMYGKGRWTDIVDLDTFKLAYLLVRKSQMNITTFGLDFLKYVHPVTGRLHCNYRTHLNTARTATTKPNLLAIPTSHRTAFTTEHLKDRKLVVHDYGSQESRVLASISNDQFFVNFFNNGHELFGDDFHSYTSDIIHRTRNPDSDLVIVPKEDPITGEKHPDFTEEMARLRQNTKTVNFGLPYGVSAISLSKQLGITIPEAEDFMKDYYLAFPEVEAHLKKRRAEGLKNGFFEMDGKLHSSFFQPGFEEFLQMQEETQSYFFSDEYRAMTKPEREEFKAELYAEKPHIKENFSYIGRMKSSIGNKACNYQIQGTSAKQSKLALIRMREYKVENNMKEWKLCLLLHDEIVSETSLENADTVLEKQGNLMVESAEWFCPNVKFTTAGGVCDAWEH